MNPKEFERELENALRWFRGEEPRRPRRTMKPYERQDEPEEREFGEDLPRWLARRLDGLRDQDAPNVPPVDPIPYDSDYISPSSSSLEESTWFLMGDRKTAQSLESVESRRARHECDPLRLIELRQHADEVFYNRNRSMYLSDSAINWYSHTLKAKIAWYSYFNKHFVCNDELTERQRETIMNL